MMEFLDQLGDCQLYQERVCSMEYVYILVNLVVEAVTKGKPHKH
jgi:hypothetical protein